MATVTILLSALATHGEVEMMEVPPLSPCLTLSRITLNQIILNYATCRTSLYFVFVAFHGILHPQGLFSQLGTWRLEATSSVCVLMARGYANLGHREPAERYLAARDMRDQPLVNRLSLPALRVLVVLNSNLGETAHMRTHYEQALKLMAKQVDTHTHMSLYTGAYMHERKAHI
jgi:hypothetical protein